MSGAATPAMPPSASLEAARFIAGLDVTGMPADVVDKARNCILYGFGIGLLCTGEATAGVAERSVAAIDGEAGSRGATSLTSGRRVPVSAAVFANAVLLHSRCQEDTSGTAHLGVVALSTALALAEAGLAEPRDMVAGIVAGYEAGGSLEAALGRETMSSGLRASALYGTLAAAATAARMMRLTPEQTDAALANAAAFTGGTLQSIPEGTDEWRYQVGTAARTGLLSASLARSGSISSRQSIEGPQGFALAFARRPFRIEELRLGRPWRILDVTFKPYPVCAHNQTVGLVGAQVHDKVGAGRIAALRLRINPYIVPGMLSRGPFSRVPETLMSTYFCCASACLYGTVSMAQLARFDDPAVLALMERMTIVPDEGVPFPSAVVDIDLVEGGTIELAERRTFADFSFKRAEVDLQLRRLAGEEGIPLEAVDLIGAFADGLPEAAPEAVVQAFALARSRSPRAGAPKKEHA